MQSLMQMFVARSASRNLSISRVSVVQKTREAALHNLVIDTYRRSSNPQDIPCYFTFTVVFLDDLSATK